MTSVWPFMYLEMECITMSAPSDKGLWKYADMNVLSTTMIGLTGQSCVSAFTAWQTAVMSTNLRVGLVGDSIQTILVLGLSPSITAWTLVMSTMEISRP